MKVFVVAPGNDVGFDDIHVFSNLNAALTAAVEIATKWYIDAELPPEYYTEDFNDIENITWEILNHHYLEGVIHVFETPLEGSMT